MKWKWGPAAVGILAWMLAWGMVARAEGPVTASVPVSVENGGDPAEAGLFLDGMLVSRVEIRAGEDGVLTTPGYAAEADDTYEIRLVGGNVGDDTVYRFRVTVSRTGEGLAASSFAYLPGSDEKVEKCRFVVPKEAGDGGPVTGTQLNRDSAPDTGQVPLGTLVISTLCFAAMAALLSLAGSIIYRKKKKE